MNESRPESLDPMDARAIASAIARGEMRAVDILESTLQRIDATHSEINAFTRLTRERAAREAEAVDTQRARGAALSPLAGVPYAVKDLFDVAGLATHAGSRLLARAAPAAQDAVLVKRLAQAGAVLVGATNMDEFAYGFTTENTHYGTTRNPWAPAHIAGGSSGGSAAAVAAGVVPLALGSDTNGSIRVPASFCGLFGLKPTFERLPRTGTYPFVADLDHLGPFARNVADLALAYDLLQGPDARDPACATRQAEPVAAAISDGIGGLRIGILGGYFDAWADDAARQSVAVAAEALGASARVEWNDAELARAAAFIITASQGGALHQHHLRDSYAELEPLSRDRLIAGLLQPASWLVQAQRLRRAFLEQALASFANVDVLLAPATPFSAPAVGSSAVLLNGQTVPVRAAAGLLTQPISFIGLPVAVAPVAAPVAGRPPAPGVQIIAAPWREDLCLRVAAVIEARCIGTAARR
jgi:aspartyl-tRNA(Asn)/glutamyl-tRNA(Gln) amidotransferase subunit A